MFRAITFTKEVEPVEEALLYVLITYLSMRERALILSLDHSIGDCPNSYLKARSFLSARNPGSLTDDVILCCFMYEIMVILIPFLGESYFGLLHVIIMFLAKIGFLLLSQGFVCLRRSLGS